GANSLTVPVNSMDLPLAARTAVVGAASTNTTSNAPSVAWVFLSTAMRTVLGAAAGVEETITPSRSIPPTALSLPKTSLALSSPLLSTALIWPKLILVTSSGIGGSGGGGG